MSIRLLFVCVVTAIFAAPFGAGAADWPSRPIRIVVPSAAGGGTDLIARVIALKISDALNQPVVIENKPGAEEIVGADFVSKASPDGYTVLMISASVAVNPSTHRKLPYDSLRDLQPVAQIATLPFVLVVNPKLPVRTLPELVAYSQKQPNGLNAAVAGTANRIVTELFRLQTGANLLLVQYKGCGPATLSVVTGETDLDFCSAPSLSQFVAEKRLTALAITGDRSLSMLPGVPTTKELAVPATHIDLAQWVGAFVRTGTPAEVTARLNAEINAALSSPEVAARINALGGVPVKSTPAEFGEFYRAEIAKYRDIVKRAQIPVDD